MHPRARPLCLLVCACLLALACDDPPPPRTVKGDPDAGVKPGKPLTALAISSLKKATAAAVRLQQSVAAGRPLRREYLTLRRNVAASQPFFRLSGKQGGTLLVGPERGTDKVGGALGQLDRALSASDGGAHGRSAPQRRSAASESLAEVIRALRMIDNELSLNEVPPEQALQALSDAIFELGLMLLEANAAVAEQPDAVVADIRGALDSIEGGAQVAVQLATGDRREEAAVALRVVVTHVGTLRAALGKLTDAHQLRDRAALVRVSGQLGVAMRRLAHELGVRTRLPYQARHSVAANRIDEPITPLTIPAPRPTAGNSDAAALAALGRQLFFDRRLARAASRSCASCHDPARAFSDGLVVATSIDAKRPITRNTPTLLYASLHAVQPWDGRLPSAEPLLPEAIHGPAATGFSSSQLRAAVAGAQQHSARFAKLFDDGVTAQNIARALRAYIAQQLVPASSPLDRFARGEDGALSADQRGGFDIFVGVGRCARCHLPPLFGGVRPPAFKVAAFAALGVPTEPGSTQLDPDRGRAMVTKKDDDAHVFRTPTVRNVGLTAPYFHNGRFSTLEQVVDFYDKGGGVGAGVAIDNQARTVRKLNLGVERKAQLIAFMRDGLQDAKLPGQR